MNNFDERQQAIWEGFNQNPSTTCQYADVLSNILEPLVSDIDRRRDLTLVYESKIVLLDELVRLFYHGKPHRFGMGTMGHTCLWHTALTYYDRIFLTERLLTPRIYLPIQPA